MSQKTFNETIFLNQLSDLLSNKNLTYSIERFFDEDDDTLYKLKVFVNNPCIEPYTHNTTIFVQANNNILFIFDYFAKSKEELKDIIKIQEQIDTIIKEI